MLPSQGVWWVEKGACVGTLKRAGSNEVGRERAGPGATGGHSDNKALGDSNHQEEQELHFWLYPLVTAG